MMMMMMMMMNGDPWISIYRLLHGKCARTVFEDVRAKIFQH